MEEGCPPQTMIQFRNNKTMVELQDAAIQWGKMRQCSQSRRRRWTCLFFPRTSGTEKNYKHTMTNLCLSSYFVRWFAIFVFFEVCFCQEESTQLMSVRLSDNLVFLLEESSYLFQAITTVGFSYPFESLLLFKLFEEQDPEDILLFFDVFPWSSIHYPLLGRQFPNSNFILWEQEKSKHSLSAKIASENQLFERLFSFDNFTLNTF